MSSECIWEVPQMAHWRKAKKEKGAGFGPGAGTYGKQRVHTWVVVNSMKENPLE